MPEPRDPRREAFDRLDGRYEVRVLEPSPPAIQTPGLIEDQVERGDVPEGRQVVGPVATADVTWAELAAGDEELAEWCRARWLADWPRLGAVPEEFAATRDALHLIAEHVLSPTRARDLGEITLRWTRGGFGTPFFGSDSQLRIEADQLVVQRGDEVTSAPITTLGDVAEFVGFELTRFEDLSYQPLAVDPVASTYLGEVFGFAFSVLEQLRADAGLLEPSFVNLWPEHFDVAVEIGSEKLGQRAAYGVSPGDSDHAEPYLYVAPWTARPDGALWRARGFDGAQMSWSELIGAEDQRVAALEFFSRRLDELVPGRPKGDGR
ncbi:MAG TPA: hypothetical protein VNT22_05085 [Baekduia sp.]|nr:hypothetical protein [Baekduia sp.]